MNTFTEYIRSPIPINKILLSAILLIFLPFHAGAQNNPQGQIKIEEGGKLWISGSATIVDYTCKARELSGNGTIKYKGQPRKNVRESGDVNITVSIPVHSLDCGKKPMNRDMYEALKANSHPNIHYELLDALLVDSTSANGNEGPSWMNIKTTGILEIAGVRDTTEILIRGKITDNNRFRVKGSKHISMDTFNIDPPTALLGLIKANKELTVKFDVAVRIKGTRQNPGITGRK